MGAYQYCEGDDARVSRIARSRAIVNDLSGNKQYSNIDVYLLTLRLFARGVPTVRSSLKHVYEKLLNFADPHNYGLNETRAKQQ